MLGTCAFLFASLPSLYISGMDHSAEAFVAALVRFVGGGKIISQLYSVNATNYTGIPYKLVKLVIASSAKGNPKFLLLFYTL